MLSQNPDDLFFREPARPHVHPLRGNGLYPFLEDVIGAQLTPNKLTKDFRVGPKETKKQKFKVQEASWRRENRRR